MAVTCGLPADGRSQGLAAHSQGFVKVFLFHQILPTGNYLVFPADGGSQGLAAHSQCFVEDLLSIWFCQLVTQEAGNYLALFFLEMVWTRAWELTVRALLRFPFPSNPSSWWHMKLIIIITYVLPADGGSRGLAAHRLGLIEVSLSIRSCHLVTQGAGNYLYSSCIWWEQRSGSSQSGFCIGFPSHQILPIALETHETGKYLCSSCRWWWWEQGSGSSQSWIGIGFPFNPILPSGDTESWQLPCSYCGWCEPGPGSLQSRFSKGFPFQTCPLVTREVGYYLCSSCRWEEQGSGSSQSWIGIGFPFHQILPSGDTWSWSLPKFFRQMVGAKVWQLTVLDW